MFVSRKRKWPSCHREGRFQPCEVTFTRVALFKFMERASNQGKCNYANLLTKLIFVIAQSCFKYNWVITIIGYVSNFGVINFHRWCSENEMYPLNNRLNNLYNNGCWWYVLKFLERRFHYMSSYGRLDRPPLDAYLKQLCHWYNSYKPVKMLSRYVSFSMNSSVEQSQLNTLSMMMCCIKLQLLFPLYPPSC